MAPKPELLKAALEAGPPKGLAALAPPKLKLGVLDAPKLKAEELCPKGELPCFEGETWVSSCLSESSIEVDG